MCRDDKIYVDLCWQGSVRMDKQLPLGWTPAQDLDMASQLLGAPENFGGPGMGGRKIGITFGIEQL